ncbi:hypothetical protein SDC9_110541 [bioreactor metagenome]|uniref:Uncharacterized protein n=1 Tax=bioreactor metagenome TaxID=1076179 RepID=A0A645BDX1_9ZZZZ
MPVLRFCIGTQKRQEEMSTKLDIKVFTDQVQKELDDANRKFPAFNSDHEGYAVLLEEYQELVHEFQSVGYHLGQAWDFTKKGNTVEIQHELKKMRTYLRRSYKELVQTAAMVEKWLDRYQPDRNWADGKTLAFPAGKALKEDEE